MPRIAPAPTIAAVFFEADAELPPLFKHMSAMAEYIIQFSMVYKSKASLVALFSQCFQSLTRRVPPPLKAEMEQAIEHRLKELGKEDLLPTKREQLALALVELDQLRAGPETVVGMEMDLTDHRRWRRVEFVGVAVADLLTGDRLAAIVRNAVDGNMHGRSVAMRLVFENEGEVRSFRELLSAAVRSAFLKHDLELGQEQVDRMFGKLNRLNLLEVGVAKSREHLAKRGMVVYGHEAGDLFERLLDSEVAEHAPMEVVWSKTPRPTAELTGAVAQSELRNLSDYRAAELQRAQGQSHTTSRVEQTPLPVVAEAKEEVATAKEERAERKESERVVGHARATSTTRSTVSMVGTAGAAASMRKRR